MPNKTSDEIITQQHKRYYYQVGGAAPGNPLVYAGADGTFLNIATLTNPVSGGINPINVQDPSAYDRYVRVGRETTAPAFPTGTVTFLERHGGIPRQLYDLVDCIVTFYEANGNCKDPSDFLNGWTDYLKVIANGEATSRTEGGGAFAADAQVEDPIDFTFEHITALGSLLFGEEAATEITTEVIDVVYGSRFQCGNCGPADSGTKLIYAVTDGVSGSPGSLPRVVYSLDGGGTWTSSIITAGLATDTPTAIEVVGQYLVVAFDDGDTGGYWITTLNAITGAPGTWTAVTTGFVSSSPPNDIYVASPREVFFVGDAGYIYKATNILSGVSVVDDGSATAQDLNRVDGVGNVIVAVGDSDAVVYSGNRGGSWTTPTNTPGSGGNLTAVAVLNDYRWWVGDNAGSVFYTDVRGETAWTSIGLPSSVATIQDVVFVTDEVGYIASATAGPAAVLFVTLNGGADWGTAGTSRLPAFPTIDRANRIAYPRVSNRAVAANNVALAGLHGDGTDGVLLLGIAAVK